MIITVTKSSIIFLIFSFEVKYLGNRKLMKIQKIILNELEHEDIIILFKIFSLSIPPYSNSMENSICKFKEHQ